MAMMNLTENLNDFLRLLQAVAVPPSGDYRLFTTKRVMCCASTSDLSPDRPLAATLTDEDIIVRDDGEEVVGVAMLHASRR